MTLSFLIDDQLFFPENTGIAEKKFLVAGVLASYLVTQTTEIDCFNKGVLVIDHHVFNAYKNRLSFSEDKLFLIVATEENKTLEMVSKLLAFFLDNRLTKLDKVIVMGGGITQEIAAFACAIYKRGIAYHHFPTTLLSMCDSCIGGKTSLNFEAAKNQLGLFYPPQKVVLYTDFLQTLSDTDMASGLGEILKTCMIGGDYYLSLYNDCIDHGKIKSMDALNKLIFSALIVKKTIVEFDEYEKKHRAALNLGHTLGHAIEAFLQYELPHGLAVVIGLILENRMSYYRGYLSQEDQHFLEKLCFSLIDEKIKSRIQAICAVQLIPLIQKDKKTLGNQVTFALLKKPGETLFLTQRIDETLLLSIEQALADF